MRQRGPKGPPSERSTGPPHPIRTSSGVMAAAVSKSWRIAEIAPDSMSGARPKVEKSADAAAASPLLNAHVTASALSRSRATGCAGRGEHDAIGGGNRVDVLRRPVERFHGPPARLRFDVVEWLRLGRGAGMSGDQGERSPRNGRRNDAGGSGRLASRSSRRMRRSPGGTPWQARPRSDERTACSLSLRGSSAPILSSLLPAGEGGPKGRMRGSGFAIDSRLRTRLIVGPGPSSGLFGHLVCSQNSMRPC